MAVSDLVLTALVFAVAAGLQGFLGFGYGMVAMAGLTLSEDLVHVSSVVNVTGLANAAWMAWALRRHVAWRLVRRIAPTLFVGVGIGVTALGRLDRDIMVATLGVVIIGVAAWNLYSPHLRQTDSPPLDAAVGIVAGMLNGAFNTGGPPLVAHLYRHPDPPDVLRATLQVVFLISGLCRLGVATAQGQITADVLRDSAVALPCVMVGLLLGLRIAQAVDPNRFRRAAWVGLGAMGVMLLAGR